METTWAVLGQRRRYPHWALNSFTLQPFTQLRTYCSAAGASLAEPPDSPAVRVAFGNIGVAVPPQIVAYLTTFGGMADDDCDDHMLALWSLDRIIAEHAGLSRGGWPFLYFGDWLISSHLYAIRLDHPDDTAVYIDYHCDHSTPPDPVADDLLDFALIVVSEPESVGVIL